MKTLISLLLLKVLLLSECLVYDDYIVDTKSNIMWAPEGVTGRRWDNALNQCATLNHGGYSNWLLPNINELLTLRTVAHQQNRPNCPDIDRLWSSTTAKITTKAYLTDGTVLTITPKTYTRGYRCIRKVY